MSLAARLARLERMIGAAPGVEACYISTASDRQEVRRICPGNYGLTVPWRPEYAAAEPDPAELVGALDPGQRAMVQRAKKVVFLVIDPGELGSADRFIGL